MGDLSGKTLFVTGASRGIGRAVAIELARSGSELPDLRARLAMNRATHPLFDTEAYTRALEALLLDAWSRH